jgi:hypothetical protein
MLNAKNVDSMDAFNALDTSPLDLMLFLSLPVTPIIINVQVLARRRQRGVTQIVSDQSQIHLLIGHVGSRAMSEPVS